MTPRVWREVTERWRGDCLVAVQSGRRSLSGRQMGDGCRLRSKPPPALFDQLPSPKDPALRAGTKARERWIINCVEHVCSQHHTPAAQAQGCSYEFAFGCCVMQMHDCPKRRGCWQFAMEMCDDAVPARWWNNGKQQQRSEGKRGPFTHRPHPPPLPLLPRPPPPPHPRPRCRCRCPFRHRQPAAGAAARSPW